MELPGSAPRGYSGADASEGSLPPAAWLAKRSAMAARIAVVGDFDPKNPTHGFTNAALDHVRLGFEWVATDEMGDDVEARLSAFDGVWVAPASPYRSMDGALGAIRYARERGVPLVGT